MFINWKENGHCINTDLNPQCFTYSQMNLIFNTMIYFRSLLSSTRAYLLSIYLGIGTAEESSALANQDDQLSCEYAIVLRVLISAQLMEILKGYTNTALYRNALDRAAFGTSDYYAKVLLDYIRLTRKSDKRTWGRNIAQKIH